jgi:hypothetical protein
MSFPLCLVEEEELGPDANNDDKGEPTGQRERGRRTQQDGGDYHLSCTNRAVERKRLEAEKLSSQDRLDGAHVLWQRTLFVMSQHQPSILSNVRTHPITDVGMNAQTEIGVVNIVGQNERLHTTVESNKQCKRFFEPPPPRVSGRKSHNPRSQSDSNLYAESNALVLQIDARDYLATKSVIYNRGIGGLPATGFAKCPL